MDTGRISRINGPRRRKFDAGLPRSPRALVRSLISIPRRPVEQLNSKKRDGWRHYERLYGAEPSLDSPKCILMLGKILSVLLSFVNSLFSFHHFLRRNVARGASETLPETMLAKELVICCAFSSERNRVERKKSQRKKSRKTTLSFDIILQQIQYVHSRENVFTTYENISLVHRK